MPYFSFLWHILPQKIDFVKIDLYKDSVKWFGEEVYKKEDP